MVDERALDAACREFKEHLYFPGTTSDDERTAIKASIEAYEAAKWRPIHEIPITPNAPVYPHYVELFNGYHVGIGYAQISEDGEERLEFWSETAEPIEPKPITFRTIDPPKQDAAQWPVDARQEAREDKSGAS